jgi:catechol 2,3-dioxygenase-like lactoylglutathione lyase family enzyme
LIHGLNVLEVITLFVEDIPATRRFYEQVFGQPVVFEDAVSAAYRFGNIVINLLQSSEADEVVQPRPVGGPEAGARALLTILVADVDATCRALADHGVACCMVPSTDRGAGAPPPSQTLPGTSGRSLRTSECKRCSAVLCSSPAPGAPRSDVFAPPPSTRRAPLLSAAQRIGRLRPCTPMKTIQHLPQAVDFGGEGCDILL